MNVYRYISYKNRFLDIHNQIPAHGLTVVVVEVEGGLGSASGGSTLHSSSDTTLNLKSSKAIHRSILSPTSASIVI